MSLLLGLAGPHTYPDPVQADVWLQRDDTLTVGETVTGTLTDQDYRHLFAFDGQENEVIALVMTQVTGDLDPYLLLTDESGNILALSDDNGVSINAEISFKRLPANGRYFVIATRFGQEHGSTSGEYTLRLDRVGAEVSEDTMLQYGESVFGRITANAPLAFYFLRAERGDVINISMRRTSGNLDPQLELATPDGFVLVTNDDDPNAEGTLDAGITNYTVYESGAYLVVATRFGREAGDTEGSYILSTSRTTPELLGTSFETARLIDYGTALESSIDDETYIRYFHFQGQRGDVITATQSNQSGNLDPLLKLADSTFSELAQDDDGGDRQDARIAAFALPFTGTYYLLATRSGEQEGRTEGTFTLELNGRPGVVGGRALEIMYGGTVSGQIDSEIPYEEYIFFGQQGDQIRVTMSRASGDLDSLVTLYDRDRKQIAFDDDSGDEKDAQIESFTLPRDDMYILVASRFEREQGTTSGAYILSLDLIRSGG